MPFITAVGLNMNEEWPIVIIETNWQVEYSTSVAIAESNCLFFKKLVLFRSYRGASLLLREVVAAVQIDTLFCLPDVWSQKSFVRSGKTSQKNYELCLNECEKANDFEFFIGWDWLADFKSVGIELLETALFDGKSR